MYLFIFEELKEKNIKLILVESDTFNELIHYINENKLGLLIIEIFQNIFI